MNKSKGDKSHQFKDKNDKLHSICWYLKRERVN